MLDHVNLLAASEDVEVNNHGNSQMHGIAHEWIIVILIMIIVFISRYIYIYYDEDNDKDNDPINADNVLCHRLSHICEDGCEWQITELMPMALWNRMPSHSSQQLVPEHRSAPEPAPE